MLTQCAAVCRRYIFSFHHARLECMQSLLFAGSGRVFELSIYRGTRVFFAASLHGSRFIPACRTTKKAATLMRWPPMLRIAHKGSARRLVRVDD